MDDERRALGVIRVAGTAVLLLGCAMLAVQPAKPVRRNVPGFLTPVVGFELASEPQHVVDLLGEIGTPEGGKAARRMMLATRLDFLFAVAYPALYVGIALFLRARRPGLRLVSHALWGLAAVMTAGDWLENRELLILCRPTDPVTMPQVLDRLRVFTLVKWYALFAASATTAVFLWQEPCRWRWPALFLAGAAVVGASSAVHLPAIEYASFLLAIAWVALYVGAFRRRAPALEREPLAGSGD